jgi:hypothetical protein
MRRGDLGTGRGMEDALGEVDVVTARQPRRIPFER